MNCFDQEGYQMYSIGWQLLFKAANSEDNSDEMFKVVKFYDNNSSPAGDVTDCY